MNSKGMNDEPPMKDNAGASMPVKYNTELKASHIANNIGIIFNKPISSFTLALFKLSSAAIVSGVISSLRT